MGIIKGKRAVDASEKSKIEALYEVIPGNILELTKKGLIRWSNVGCTVESWIILEEADVYEARFAKHTYLKSHPIFDIKLRLLISDDDCILLIGDNLISNAVVCRLKNWIKMNEKKQTSAICRWMESYNNDLAAIYEEAEEFQKSLKSPFSLNKEENYDT